MKFISFGKINKKIYLYILISIIVEVGLASINIYFENNKDEVIENIFLKNIISFSFFLFFIIPYIWPKIFSSQEKQKYKSYNNNKIRYNYQTPPKLIKIKTLIISILWITLYFIVSSSFGLIYGNYPQFLKFGSNECYSVIDILYLYLYFRFRRKILFYKHLILSIIFIFLMELTRYVDKLLIVILLKNEKFELPTDFLSLVPLLLFPLVDAIQYYKLKYFMQYYYYSLPFIGLLVGIIFTIFSTVLYSIFTNLDIDKNNFFNLFSTTTKRIENLSWISILIYIIQSLLYCFCFVARLLIMNDFNVFHLIIPFSINSLINSIFNIWKEFSINELIIIIITFLIEIISTFILLEIIELNFCGLNNNLRKNIIKRATKEKGLIYEINRRDNSLDSSESDLVIDSKIISDNSSEYD